MDSSVLPKMNFQITFLRETLRILALFEVNYFAATSAKDTQSVAKRNLKFGDLLYKITVL